MAPPSRKPKKRPLSLVTRYLVVPLLLLALGIRIGMHIGAARLPAAPAAQLAAPIPGRPSCPCARGSGQDGRRFAGLRDHRFVPE